MPMILRDGKVYKSKPSVHMMLRDGKLVDSSRASLYGRGPSASPSPRKRGARSRSLTSDPLIREKRANLAPRFVQSDGLNAMAETRELAAGQTRSEKVVEEVHFATSRSRKAYKTVSSTKLVIGKGKKEVGLFQNAGDDSASFLTSTPLLNSTTVEQKSEYAGEESFTFPTAADDVGKKLVYSVADSSGSSFTRIKTSEKRRNNNKTGSIPTTPPNRSKLGDIKSDTVEQNIFEDLSKSFLYTYLSDDISQSEADGDQTDSSISFRGKSFSYPHLRNEEEDLRLDHAGWGRSHHWRRQWYLNRWKIDTTRINQRSWFSVFYQTIVTTFLTIQTLLLLKMSRVVSRVVSFFSSIDSTTKTRRLKRIGSNTNTYRFWYYADGKDFKKTKRQFFCFFCLPLFISLLVVAALSYSSLKHVISSHNEKDACLNLTELGLKNAYSVFLGKDTQQLPVWHVFPDTRKTPDKEKSLSNGFPVVFYVRNSGRVDAKHSVEIFKALSAAGYNIVIPVYPKSGRQIIDPWKTVYRSTGGSHVYLWGDKIEASYMSELAKDLCREGVPPSGVIIITDTFDKNMPVQSYEVWSCNCLTKQKQDGSPFSYTHIKCPVSDANIHHDVTQCLQALGM